MIKVTLYKYNDNIYGFKIKEHGDKIVCAAVSILSLNTVNSLESLTSSKFNLNYNKKGGLLECSIQKESFTQEAALLLRSLELGLNGIKSSYSNEIDIKYEEVQL